MRVSSPRGTYVLEVTGQVGTLHDADGGREDDREDLAPVAHAI